MPRALLEAVRTHVEAGYPNEACGALVGRAGERGAGHEILEFHPMRNLEADRPRDRYALDPLEQLRIQKQADSQGLEIVGFVHSHPDHPARPSRYDAERAWPFYSYLVVAVLGGRMTEARSWRLNEVEGTFREEPLQIS